MVCTTACFLASDIEAVEASASPYVRLMSGAVQMPVLS
jgi:hypothetical protein